MTHFKGPSSPDQVLGVNRQFPSHLASQPSAAAPFHCLLFILCYFILLLLFYGLLKYNLLKKL